MGMFSMMFVDEKSLATDEPLFRAGFAVCLMGFICFIMSAHYLYMLFEATDASLTRLMNTFVIIGTSMVFVCRSAGIAGLTGIQTNGEMAAEIFWDLWLLPLGILVIKSELMPKIIGILLLATGVAHLADFFVYFLASGVAETVQPILYIIETPGEFGLVLYLLIKGVKTQKSDALSND